MTTANEAFEKWANEDGYMLERIQDNHNTYEFYSTMHAWLGWKASALNSASEIARLKLVADEYNSLILHMDSGGDFYEFMESKLKEVNCYE